ncbi:MAG: hypothetical protein V4649_01020 [Bacteroidota bacterium]
MRNLIIAVLLCIGVATSATAQEVYKSSGKKTYSKKKKTGYDPDKLIIGGGLNAGFGTGYTNVGISPIVGYRITKDFSAGVGVGYQYFRQFLFEDQGKKWFQSYNIIYPNVWARYFVYRNIFFDATYEQDFITLKRPGVNYTTGAWEMKKTAVANPCLLLGVGVKQPIGGRVSFLAEIMYDVLQNDYSPYYGMPVLRFSIVAGI